MTNIYSLFPARREETLFRDHNLIAFFVSRLSKSNLRVHRVREFHAGVRAHGVFLEYQYRTIRTLFMQGWSIWSQSSRYHGNDIKTIAPCPHAVYTSMKCSSRREILAIVSLRDFLSSLQ
jgi:hypothetical protein